METLENKSKAFAKAVKKGSEFTSKVTADGSSGFLAESGRYHLYVSLNCPFAGRTLVGRALKGLQDAITVTILDWKMTDGWKFTDEKPLCTADNINSCTTLKQIYQLASPGYDGRVTVPVLWDKKLSTIVSNDSAEILRMINSEFNAFCRTPEQSKLDLYPEPLRQKIDEINDWVKPNINLGVYSAGFARDQEAYNAAVVLLFEHMDKAETILAKQRYLTGNTLTEADVRLFTSLCRFDAVYYLHFKCNKRRVVAYPNLWAYTRDIYQMPDVSDTVNMDHITKGYYESHLYLNVAGIVPIGPDDIDFAAPHDRNVLSDRT